MAELEPITVTAQRISADDLTTARDAGASESDLNLIRTLKERAAEFEAARQDLIARGPAIARTNDYDLMVEYGELVNRSETIRAKIQAATQAIDAAIKWALGTVGKTGTKQLSALGVVWFLPAAVITAATAVIGYWMADYLKFTQRFREQARIAADLQAQGMDPAEAQRQAALSVQSIAPTLWSSLSTPLLVGAFGVLAYLWYQGRN